MAKSDAGRFVGFPKEGLSFLRQLAKHNEREWFNPRKAEYESTCREPMERLAGELNSWFRANAVEYAVEDPRKSVQRIYRDTRFAKDKTPYKTHVACFFARKGFAKNCGPDFYIQISPAGVGIAGGIYMPGAEELRAIREAILDDFAGFRKACCGKALVKSMGEMRGATLTRLPKGFETAEDSNAEEWVKRKQFFYWAESPVAMALDRGLPKELCRRIELMLPACEWLADALRAAAGQDADNRPKRPEPMF
jgi:uncharacterized protein (TIGR02453 family)